MGAATVSVPLCGHGGKRGEGVTATPSPNLLCVTLSLPSSKLREGEEREAKRQRDRGEGKENRQEDRQQPSWFLCVMSATPCCVAGSTVSRCWIDRRKSDGLRTDRQSFIF